ncbi:hypothetical protein [Scatolibacter rhodanostii]|uniref:hypothetical protein n=1 Tax=Scatolibacter rhodanostii TaxID=2014781 RepID=UPI001FA90784|nr:hypothetical protein [Scatolibacter rhodanostii]
MSHNRYAIIASHYSESKNLKPNEGAIYIKKIYIIGIVASGKTTLAKKLSSQLHIPWHELDCIVHKRTPTGRVKQSPQEQQNQIQQIDTTGKWIFEGVYRESYHCLLDMADKIVFLDIPLRIRKFRIFTRFLKQNLKLEPCEYKPDFKMLRLMYKWTDDFEKGKPDFLTMLNRYQDKVIVLSTPKEIDEFIHLNH